MYRDYSTTMPQHVGQTTAGASDPLAPLRCSTPKQQQPKTSRSQIEELKKDLSKMALELEEARYEADKLFQENEQLRQENDQLRISLREKETIQSQMREQLELVTQTAYTIYDRFRSFKARYYENQGINAWTNGSTGKPANTMVGDDRG